MGQLTEAFLASQGITPAKPAIGLQASDVIEPAPFRRFGEYVPSACDAWNRDEPLEEE